MGFNEFEKKGRERKEKRKSGVDGVPRVILLVSTRMNIHDKKV